LDQRNQCKRKVATCLNNYAELLAPIGFSEDEIAARVSDQSKSEQKTDSVRKRSAHYALRFVCLVTDGDWQFIHLRDRIP